MARSNRKTGKCPSCCPNGGAIFERDMDWNVEVGPGEVRPHVWRCCNCGHTMTLRKSPELPTKPTAAQLKAIEAIKAEIFRMRSYNGNQADYEFKRCEMNFQAETGNVFLVTEFGKKNDEGTVGSITRDYRHFVIGIKGGVELLNAKEKTKRGKHKYPKGIFHSCNATTL